jgi:hypothetical protein
MMQPHQIISMAQDRTSWRKLVVACSASDWWWWWGSWKNALPLKLTQ